MSAIDKTKITLQYILPKHLVTRVVGRLASARAGWLTRILIKAFIRNFSVNMSEAAEPNPKKYKTFNEFFTRPLKEGARPIQAEQGQLIHPVDGTVSQAGDIEEGKLIQAKGHKYSVHDLMGGDHELNSYFEKGDFATIYLAPRDYHRIHMPCAATLKEMIYVPGSLFSVNPLTARHVPNLFARNERVIAVFESEQGPFAMILVGATIVGSIETTWAGTVTPPTGPKVQRWSYPTQGNTAIRFEQGDEMGRFKLGSTVIMLFGDDQVDFLDDLQPGKTTRMGEVMAEWENAS
ncbi:MULTISPECIES: archaetidylserine decarboxylase [Gammaproteobacteria]|uniref:archaetidylserine decarboxylase n=1 Tax=Gammaproteobacteria TaxID=1236 RepID=UPI000DD017BD|nr:MULTISPECIES: archaetidylserine decarboxylase [Gammaproteobacteria]RTE85703.1 phosphatidylserine decarboxylase [Aliidiomarina sp. B3213]TCZ90297.1 phosphatidylserine decarboxylase [Lysobacter sp. N42]